MLIKCFNSIELLESLALVDSTMVSNVIKESSITWIQCASPHD